MTNPVLVEITRGDLVESRHRGAVAVVDGDGNNVLQIGDVDKPVFPRSAAKALQALPLMESGAAKHYDLQPHELALACSSHAGEPGHVETAQSILAKAGLDHTALECGCHRPSNESASLAMAQRGDKLTTLHNNCSGKHAGFLCLACHQNIDHRGYIDRKHRIQKEIKATLEHLTGVAHDEDHCGIDGCSIPTYAVPLSSLAHGFAIFATGTGLAPLRAEAANALYSACVNNPWYVAGTDRACTDIMRAGSRRVFVKTGAEGVYCAAIPELGMGIALKCDDGTTRAAESMVANVIANLLQNDDDSGNAIRVIANPVLKNRNGIVVGAIRAAGELADQ